MSSKLNFDAAKSYIFTHGRKLEQLRFNFDFEKGSPDDVMTELVKFQNEDGGFGHGLECDLRSKSSSVIATTHALSICREIGIKTHSLIDNALQYLIDSYDAKFLAFPIITPKVRDVPHPWWWQGDVAKNFMEFQINPSVEVLSHLLHFDAEIPENFFETTINRIKSLKSLGIYDVRCIRHLLHTEKLDDNLRVELKEKISSLITPEISTEKWDGYGMYPLGIVRHPGDVFEEAVGEDLIQKNFEYDIQSQMEDGSWSLNWSWAEIDQNLWAEAEKDWKGVIALEKLLVFRAFHYL